MTKQKPLSFLHDANARYDDRILVLRKRHGWAGYGLFWAIVETLRDSTDLRFPLDRIPALAFSLQCDEAELQALVATCIEVQLLCTDKHMLWSASLDQRIANYHADTERRSKAARDGWEERRRRQAAKKQEPEESQVDNLERSADSEQRNAHAKQSSVCAEGLQSDALQPQYNIIQSNTIQSKEGESEGEGPAPANGVPPPAGYRHKLGSLFRPWNPDADWAKTNRVINGELPLKQYPLIFIKPSDLETAIGLWDRGGIPKEDRRLIFEKVNARLQDMVKNGGFGTLERVSPYNWLIGWAYEQTLDAVTKAGRLKQVTGAQKERPKRDNSGGWKHNAVD
ncbi:MAG: DUF4373 domain-containing protein [Candidatus Latescibacteria bacterium]|nr:DUF4373 domain-containing protein [Candidatus Latescibacterota bacterium]NIO78083.1 DUF4373 domain-containing protein [Candidatus Latescibacterota bacterium]